MSFEKILKEIKSLEQFTTENVDGGPVATLSGRRGRKIQAIEKTKVLTEQYVQEFQKNAIYIAVIGSNGDEFTKIVGTKENGCFVANTEQFYQDLEIGRAHV